MGEYGANIKFRRGRIGESSNSFLEPYDKIRMLIYQGAGLPS